MQNGDSYNKGGLIALIFSVVFSLLFFAWISLKYEGIDLKEVPEEAKTPSAQEAAPAAAAFDASKVAKPWEPSEEMANHGKDLFKVTCSACHGNEGKGDGPAGASLVPPPRNLVEGKWKQGGDTISLFNTVAGGIKGSSMAPFGHLPVNDRWALVQFIRSITQNKVADDAAKLEEFGKTAK